jgi:folate-binding protein YgfZ
MPQVCILDDHRLITVSGPDCHSFLQGQLTQDVNRVSAARAVMAGWADAKGRLQWAGQLFLYGEAIAMLVPAGIAAFILSRLRMYVLRAKAELAIADIAIAGLINVADAMATSEACPWVQLAGDSTRGLAIGPRTALDTLVDSAGTNRVSPQAWTLCDIRAGLPEITMITAGEFVPQMVNLDLLDGISFSKGCYTGQEIVARTKYRGRIKRRMLRFECEGTVEAGADIFAERGPVGKVVRAAPAGSGSELLAVIHLDDLSGPLFTDEAHNRPITRLPLSYDVPT